MYWLLFRNPSTPVFLQQVSSWILKNEILGGKKKKRQPWHCINQPGKLNDSCYWKDSLITVGFLFYTDKITEAKSKVHIYMDTFPPEGEKTPPQTQQRSTWLQGWHWTQDRFSSDTVISSTSLWRGPAVPAAEGDRKAHMTEFFRWFNILCSGLPERWPQYDSAVSRALVFTSPKGRIEQTELNVC